MHRAARRLELARKEPGPKDPIRSVQLTGWRVQHDTVENFVRDLIVERQLTLVPAHKYRGVPSRAEAMTLFMHLYQLLYDFLRN